MWSLSYTFAVPSVQVLVERFKDEIVVNDILGNTDELQQMLLKAFQEADPDNCGMLSQRQVRAARRAALSPPYHSPLCRIAFQEQPYSQQVISFSPVHPHNHTSCNPRAECPMSCTVPVSCSLTHTSVHPDALFMAPADQVHLQGAVVQPPGADHAADGVAGGPGAHHARRHGAVHPVRAAGRLHHQVPQTDTGHAMF